jgi:hypothetical protein
MCGVGQKTGRRKTKCSRWQWELTKKNKKKGVARLRAGLGAAQAQQHALHVKRLHVRGKEFIYIYIYLKKMIYPSEMHAT